MKLNVNVTAADIRAGKKNSPSFCPIALAVRRLTPHHNVCVDDRIQVGYDKSATLPPEAIKFISEFDCGMKVEPFTFLTELTNDAYGD